MKGIMFNEHFGLESAVLSGRKTQTRRVIKKVENAEFLGWHDLDIAVFQDKCTFARTYIESPYKVGEIVAIKQSYEAIKHQIPCYGDVFMANNINISNAGYYNKMFVKNELMPHKIKITNTRVGRLQDISEEDCLKEGVSIEDDEYSGFPPFCLDKCNDLFHTAQDAFAVLIDKVNGKGTWQYNPFVWVIEFELI